MTKALQRFSGLIPLVSMAALLALTACSKNADRDGDGEISKDERAAQIPQDLALPLRPGRWETKVAFTQIYVTGLSDKRKQGIMAKMSKAASRVSCLNEQEAKQPPADFFGGGMKKACKYRSFTAQDNQIKIGLSCAMDGMAIADMDLSGQVTEEDTALDIAADLRLPMIGKVGLKGTSAGHYLGECEG
jgi:Protein of unknown function (DUF3617)